MLTLRFSESDPEWTFSLKGTASISLEYVRDFDILSARGLPRHRTRHDHQHEAHRVGNPIDHRSPPQDVAIVGRGCGRIADDEKWQADHCDKQNGRTDPRCPS